MRHATQDGTARAGSAQIPATSATPRPTAVTRSTAAVKLGDGYLVDVRAGVSLADVQSYAGAYLATCRDLAESIGMFDGDDASEDVRTKAWAIHYLAELVMGLVEAVRP